MSSGSGRQTHHIEGPALSGGDVSFADSLCEPRGVGVGLKTCPTAHAVDKAVVMFAVAHLAHSCRENDVDLCRPKFRMKSLSVGDMHLVPVGENVQAMAVDPLSNAMLIVGGDIVDIIGKIDVAVSTGDVNDKPMLILVDESQEVRIAASSRQLKPVCEVAAHIMLVSIQKTP